MLKATHMFKKCLKLGDKFEKNRRILFRVCIVLKAVYLLKCFFENQSKSYQGFYR